jgi:glucosylceramidase
MDTAPNEKSYLLGNGGSLASSDDKKSGSWPIAAKLVLVAVTAMVATKWWDVNNLPSTSIDGTPLTNSEHQPPASLHYRPVCMTYDSQTTARILQTSMGSPSQQWSRIPCYSQPEKVRSWTKSIFKPDVNLNSYGSPDAILQVNLSQPAFSSNRQILGFGAAFTEAASLNYQSLSEKGKKTLMDLFFGKSGLGYSLGRVHINSCDFSVESYSFDDVDGDFKLEHFDMNVTHDAQPDGMIDMIKRASSVFRTNWWTPPLPDRENATVDDGLFKMYASPWSPPAWMKRPTSSDASGAIHAENMTGSTEPSCLLQGTGPESKYARAWALYFSKFITACKKFLVYPILTL